MTDGQIRVIEASHRRAASPNGCRIAVEFVRDGESGTEMQFLDEFLEEHAGGVTMGVAD